MSYASIYIEVDDVETNITNSACHIHLSDDFVVHMPIASAEALAHSILQATQDAELIAEAERETIERSE